MDYTVPSFGAQPSTIHGWLASAVQEGEAWLKVQRPATEWNRVLDALAPADTSQFLDDQSNTGYNKTKRIARELVASLANFKYEGEFRVQYDQTLAPQAQHLTKRDRVWFQQAHVHEVFRQILQYGVAMGTGYGLQVWDKSFWGPGQGDVRLSALAPDQVTFIQLPQDADMQRAYAVLIREELPINLARRIYATQNAQFAARLMPDRDAPGWVEKGLRKMQQLMGGSPIFKYTGRENKGNTSFPTVYIYHAYIMDDSLNTGPAPRLMGEPGTNWSYTVPVLGSDIPSGIRDTAGTMLTRKATENDCLLFPTRRYCIFSSSVDFPCYDGPSPWWHGKVPLGRFRFGDWAWEALGSSLLGDILTINNGIESIMRDVEDSSHARMDPPALFDDSKVSKSWADAVNPRRAGVRAAADMNFGEVFKILGQQWQYEVPEWIVEWVKSQEGRMDYLAAAPDIAAVAKAKQVPGEGTLEKIMEMAGPLVQDMIRSVEAPQYDMGEMRKSLYVQFDTRSRWMQLAGPDADSADFEWTPSLLTPANLGDLDPEARRASVKLYTHEFRYHTSQSGVNEIHRLSMKLFYLQLMKAGFPIDWWTFAKIAQIPNFGPAPMDEEGNEITTVIERWVAQQHMQQELAEEGGQGQPPAKGRPPSNQKPASIGQKPGGRPVVKTA